MKVQRFRNQSVSGASRAAEGRRAVEATIPVLPTMSERRLEGPPDRLAHPSVSPHAIRSFASGSSIASLIFHEPGLPAESVGSPGEASCV
jgi:hypothetical protein